MSLGHERILIEPGDLARLDQPVLFVDTRIGADYRRGHVAGAIHLDTFPYANERTDDEGWPAVVDDWRTTFASAGIDRDDAVIFYDCGLENRAPRNGFMLRYLGHPRAYVLHGGMTAWLREGGEVSKEQTARPPVPALSARLLDEMVARIDQVADALGRPETVFLDVRDTGEFEGRVRLQWNPRMGRIPGSVPLLWTSLLEQGQTDRALVGTPYYRTHTLIGLRPDRDLRRELDAVGVAPERELVVYCQKSHRACTVYVALEHLGFRRARVYPGSFREWSRRRDLPVAR